MTDFGAFHTRAWLRPRIRCSILSITSAVVRPKPCRVVWDKKRRWLCSSMSRLLEVDGGHNPLCPPPTTVVEYRPAGARRQLSKCGQESLHQLSYATFSSASIAWHA